MFQSFLEKSSVPFSRANSGVILFFCANFLLFVNQKCICDASSSSGVLTLTHCNREPVGISRSKTPGDNGFTVEISGNPEKYVPGVKYTVTVHGVRTHASVQKFTGFTLAVEPSDLRSEIEIKDAGTFHLMGDARTKFSDHCQNAVVHTSPVLKSEIQVLWTAPKPGSGCVQFKATVVEREMWYMDDGSLTKRLCEEAQENPDEQSDVLEECKACDEAKYEVTFQGLWSRHTHPNKFPEDNWLTHFSNIIGASHSPNYTMWEYGGYATHGLKHVAETGNPNYLEAEIKQQSSNIRTIIKAPGLWYPNLNGSTFAVFRVDHKHHLMSLVTMLGPSPDWIVGVSRLELCTANNSWIAQKHLNLYPWDAGTDSGTNYMSRDASTIPPEKIRQIKSNFPNNEDSPFYDPSGKPMKPVAQLTVTMQRLYHKKSCDTILNGIDIDDNLPTEIPDTDSRMECAVMDWVYRTPCSASCGKGIRIRTRQYRNPMKATMVGCSTQLELREMCIGESPTCENEDPEQCAVSSWSQWSECGVTCGKGTRTRFRRYLHPKDRKTCYTILMEKTPCMADEQNCEHQPPFDPQCAVTQWSEWSPCMVTCGKGFQVRTRIYLNTHSASICRMELMQKQMCMANKADCNYGMQEAKEICSQPKDEGPCRGFYPRWYFDITRKSCLQFSYGGCRGNQNNFKNHEQCNQVCDILKVPIDSPIVSSGGFSIPFTLQPSTSHTGSIPIDCMVSQWSSWSTCSVTCSRGQRHRQRMVKIEAQNGGKTCPRKLSQTKKCNMNKPCRK